MSKQPIWVNRVAELDAQLLEMAAHLGEEFYPCFLTAIFGRQWILTHGLKLVLLKCLQSSEYLQALGQAIGCAINKGIRDGLSWESWDGPIRRRMMWSLVKLPYHFLFKLFTLESKGLIGEASTSAAPATAEPITTLSIIFSSFGVVPPFSVSDYQVSDPEPHNKDPPATTFEEKELDTIPEPTVVS
ncbi:hypothetical protein Tco_1151071 [Tanacetum coccineum]